MNNIANYQNGNAIIKLFDNGTRIIETYDDKLDLDYPLNLDIRVSTSCSFANNICKEFCHESAIVNGKDCDYIKLQSKLEILPKGIELAIGCNKLTDNLYEFLIWCYNKGFICNITVNQGHLQRDLQMIEKAINNNYIKGLGVSYRKELKWNVPEFILNYNNTAFNIIIGIDNFKDIESLKNKNVRKIILLGEKDFGFNQNKVDLNSRNHQEWKWWIHKLFNQFEVVSFDNLAIQQLDIKRFFTNDNWDKFYNGEYSFYIDAVNKFFAPSSRNSSKLDWDKTNVLDYFKSLQK